MALNRQGAAAAAVVDGVRLHRRINVTRVNLGKGDTGRNHLGGLLRRTKDIAYVKLLKLFPKSERPNFSQRIKDYAETFASEINLSPSHIAECINKMRQEPP